MVGLNQWDKLKCYGNIARRTLEENFMDKTPLKIGLIKKLLWPML